MEDMVIEKMVPFVIYDNECYLCIQFAKVVNFLTKGRLRLVGHYTDFGEEVRDDILDTSALEMFWFIDEKTAYGGRAAIGALFSAILHGNGKNIRKKNIGDSCTRGCKSPKVVFFRLASLLTRSKRINLRKP